MPFAPVSGQWIAYESAGAGPPVLLVHGLGSSLFDWERQIGPLSERYRVIAIDLRGHGQSWKPHRPFRIADLAQDAVAVLDYLKIDAAHWVGLSLGGAVALEAAAAAPQRVRSLVVVNSPPAYRPRSAGDATALFYRRFLVWLYSMNTLGAFLARRALPGAGHQALRERLTERFARNDKRCYRLAFDALRAWSVEDRLAGIRAPTLVLSAELDYVPQSAKEAVARAIPGARLSLLPGAHHMAPLEVSDLFNRELLAFLDAVEADSGAPREGAAAAAETPREAGPPA